MSPFLGVTAGRGLVTVFGGDSRPGTCHRSFLDYIGLELSGIPSYTSIAPALFPVPMYRVKLVPGKSTSNFPVFQIRLVLKSLPQEIFTSEQGIFNIR